MEIDMSEQEKALIECSISGCEYYSNSCCRECGLLFCVNHMSDRNMCQNCKIRSEASHKAEMAICLPEITGIVVLSGILTILFVSTLFSFVLDDKMIAIYLLTILPVLVCIYFGLRIWAKKRLRAMNLIISSISRQAIPIRQDIKNNGFSLKKFEREDTIKLYYCLFCIKRKEDTLIV